MNYWSGESIWIETQLGLGCLSSFFSTVFLEGKWINSNIKGVSSCFPLEISVGVTRTVFLTGSSKLKNIIGTRVIIAVLLGGGGGAIASSGWGWG